MMTLQDPPATNTRDPRLRRPWRKKFHAALRGCKLGIRGHSSFFIHFFFTALVLAAALVLQCDLIEWCLLVLCIGGVLTAELVNSAVETLFRGLDEATKASILAGPRHRRRRRAAGQRHRGPGRLDHLHPSHPHDDVARGIARQPFFNDTFSARTAPRER